MFHAKSAKLKHEKYAKHSFEETKHLNFSHARTTISPSSVLRYFWITDFWKIPIIGEISI